jgi:hypothetical protein
VLFSQNNIADFINTYFEPVWESVRPVPVLRLDFGNGTVLTRTLHGNILTSVCTADGRVLDALPGIYTAAAYLERLDQFRLLSRYVEAKPVHERAATLKDYHVRQAEALKKKESPESFVLKKRKAPPTKARIEAAVEVVLEATPHRVTRPDNDKAPAAVENVTGWKELAEDTALNEGTRRLQIHELLAKLGLIAPQQVLHPIYKDVLHADLDDPYLGLGKVLFGSYPFAREDEGR